MTKIRHHIEKLCFTPKDVGAIEQDIEQLWSLLEITLEILDELCVVYLENGEETNKQAAMEEGQALESEIQAAIEKAHEAVKSHTLKFLLRLLHTINSSLIQVRRSFCRVRSTQFHLHRLPKVLTAVKKKQEFLKARQPAIN